MQPRVLFKNIITDTNVSITSHVPPNDIDGALSFLTYEFWEFEESQRVDITITDNDTADALGIYGEGLIGVEVVVSYSQDAIDYTVAHTGEIEQDGTTLFIFNQIISANYWRIIFTTASDADCIIRNLSLGQSLAFERCLMGTFAPSPYNRRTNLLSSGSGEAQFLSKRFNYEGFETDVSLPMMSSTWARREFQEFVNHARSSAYFFSWNPELYPSEAIFGWSERDIGIEYSGDAALMQADFRVRR